MIKIDENIDLSKQVLDIDINSPVFYGLLQDLNEEIQRCVRKIYDKEFEAGEISVKLNLEILNAYKTIPRTNDLGELINDTYKYRQPNFKHTVTSTLKKRYKQEGVFTGESEVVYDDDKFIVVPLKNEQISIEDY
ncbi:MAG: hypothetical protein E7211_00325 [Clostridium lundense]|nr:hypothetical protein [Clostridium lundense]